MLTYAQAVVEGQALSYATEGSGQPLLLLHGLGFDHQAWAAAAPFLAGHFRLVIPDLPGFGKSRAVAWDGAPGSMIRAAAGLMTATQAVPGFVAGAGLGGTLALALAARHPERIRAAVVIGAPGIQIWPATPQGRAGRLLHRVPGLLSLALRLAPRAHATRFLRDSLAGGEPTAEIVRSIALMLRDPDSRQALARGLARLDEWQLVLRQLGGVRAPVLLVWGERDALYGVAQAERLRHAVPGSQLVTVAGAGHAVPIERPADLAALIRRFLSPGPARR
jgi:pimeloyl-ACP methyl ester carboxylesterase